MTDGPGTGDEKRGTVEGKPSGTDSGKSGEGSNTKAPTKPASSSGTAKPARQSAQQSAAGDKTQQPSQASSSGAAQQPTQGDSAPSGTDPKVAQPGSFPQGGIRADLELTKRCEELIESFRRGQAGKGATVLAIASVLGKATLKGADKDTVEAAFESYTAQVDEVTKYRQDNAPSTSPDLTAEREGAESETRDRSQTLGKSKGKGRTRRERSASISRSSSPDERDSDSFSEDEHPARKRRKQDPSLFAWSSQENEIAESALRPELRETLRLIRNHDFDIKKARSSLRNSVGVPEFPEAEWTNVLLGRPIDLNHVLSGQYTLEQDEKTVQKLGLVELTYRTVTPSRVVRTAGDWTTAWQRATAAILYVFPHRRTELDGYFHHIFGLFSSIHPSHHNRIIDYDCSVRKRASAMRTLLLTDADRFSDLRDRFVNSFGVATDGVSEEGKKRGGSRRKPRDKEDEACRRWNRGACDAGDAGCKYIHRCSLCNAADHPLSRCPKSSKRTT